MEREGPEPLKGLETRLGRLGIAFAALYLGSVYIKVPFLRPGLTVGDAIDVATPLVLVFLYAMVGRGLSAASAPGDPGLGRGVSMGPRMLLILGGFALVLGHGMHVAANSIDDAIVRARALDPEGLVHWWDERASHFLIDASKAAISVGLTALESRSERAGSAQGRAGIGFLTLGAAAYGFIYFAASVEGQTTILLLPFCVAYLVWSLRRGRPFKPVRRFYTLGAFVSILFFAVWGIWHRGFPEFSAVGLIP